MIISLEQSKRRGGVLDHVITLIADKVFRKEVSHIFALAYIMFGTLLEFL
jgi:hypothetical protein